MGSKGAELCAGKRRTIGDLVDVKPKELRADFLMTGGSEIG